MAKHGTRGAYTAGCRCPECRDANRVYSTNRKRAARGEGPVPADLKLVPDRNITPDDPDDGERVIGVVEAAVIEELSNMSATAMYPGQAQAAMALARVMDDRLLGTTWPSAHRQLKVQLDALAAMSAPAVSRLKRVAAMSQRGNRTG